MQKKRNIKFRAIDIAIIVACLSGSIFSGAAFWQEYNRTLTKLNEEPVGIITFKQRTAQRKFIDRVVWDRLKQTSPVYNGDTIRTIEFSEAVITFRNEVTQLSLFENTLIQIFYDDIDGARIELAGGNLEIVSGSGSVMVNSGSSSVIIDGQADINMDNEGFSLSVFNGAAILNGETIETGNIISLTERGERNLNPAIMMKTLGNTSRILTPQGETAFVEFSWNVFNFNPDTFVIIDISLDRNFDRILHRIEATDSSSVIIPLESGNYRWRAYPADSNSGGMPVNRIYPSGTIEIIPVTTVQLIAPAQNAEFIINEDTGVQFTWAAAQNATSYLLEIADNADMNNPVISRTSQRTALTVTELNEGRWYWRITPNLPNWVTGNLPPSGVNSFSQYSPGNIPAAAIIIEPEPEPQPIIEEPVPPPAPAPVIAQPEPVVVQPQPVIEPEPVIAQPEPVIAQPEPVIEPEPVIAQPEPVVVQPQPVIEPEPQPIIATPEPMTVITQPEAPEQLNLREVSAAGTVTNSFPHDNFVIYTEQTRNAPSLYFSWEGRANGYEFVLYRADGEIVIPRTPVRDASFTLDNPNILAAGEYIWQVFEQNRRGETSALPSMANSFTVRAGIPPVRMLPTIEPGVLYGNQ